MEFSSMDLNLFIGFDFSTQSLKCTILEERNGSLVVYSGESFNFDRDFSRFNTTNGMHHEGKTATSPCFMWFAALDELLKSLKAKQFPFDQVKAISASAQQHGTMYFKQGAADIIASMDPTQSLEQVLKNAFSITECPIWADSSTEDECTELEKQLGGALNSSALTGSTVHARFAGPQIFKLCKNKKNEIRSTERISLISNGIASIFLGRYSCIDFTDGCGMNLLCISTKQWCKQALKVCSCDGEFDLEKLLGTSLHESTRILGAISPYFVDRYHFNPNCQIVSFTGDNPASLVGLGISSPGSIAISLGTSETIFGVSKTFQPGLEGHVFINPIDEGNYMIMLCYQNGSLVRQFYCDQYFDSNWDLFNSMLSETAATNQGIIGFNFLTTEITPNITTPGEIYFDSNSNEIDATQLSLAQKIRCIVEYRFLSMMHHSSKVMDYHKIERIIVTGGASSNIEICRIISNIFGCNIYSCEQSDSASLGAAYKAYYSINREKSNQTFQQLVTSKIDYKLVCEFDPVASDLYANILRDRFSIIEHKMTQSLNKR